MERAAAALGIALAYMAALTATASADSHEMTGRRVFEAKQCAHCHAPGGRSDGVPPLDAIRGPQGAWELTGRFWNHVPAMFTALSASGVSWPTFTPEEMQALMAYLGAASAADPKPDAARGHTILVQKGCLKCHSLRGEGARVAPDLAERTATFASPPTWAARIWTHTPVMASVAMQRGVLYPRFTGQEMVHLVEFLKTRGTVPRTP